MYRAISSGSTSLHSDKATSLPSSIGASGQESSYSNMRTAVPRTVRAYSLRRDIRYSRRLFGMPAERGSDRLWTSPRDVLSRSAHRPFHRPRRLISGTIWRLSAISKSDYDTQGGSPKKAKAPVFTRVLRGVIWWAILGSNQGPHAYQACALTN